MSSVGDSSGTGIEETLIGELEPLIAAKLKAAFAAVMAEAKSLLRTGTVKADKPPVVRHEFTVDAFTDALYGAARRELQLLPQVVRDALEKAALAGVGHGASAINLEDLEPVQSSLGEAKDYAAARSAEMVGMKRTAGGELAENPSARWAITETTRNDLRQAIEETLDSKLPIKALRQAIEDAGTFSPERAAMISRTEVKLAMSHGNNAIWKKSGVVEKVGWLLGQNPCLICIGNSETTVDLGKMFPGGVEYPPQHPNCNCTTYAAKLKNAGKVQ